MPRIPHGRQLCNETFTQVGPMISVKDLKNQYLFGIGIKDAQGNEMSDQILQHYISAAASLLEHDLGIAIMPQAIVEVKDYFANEYFDWSYFQLNNSPLVSVEYIKASYSRDENLLDSGTVLEIPKQWWRVSKDSGIIRLVPNNKFPSNLQIDPQGVWFPELFRRHGHVPDLWMISYTYGFEEGKVPIIINQAIGLTAALMALSIAGNLILGAGIAATSIGMDGLSQSVSTTQSAEFSGYSATRKEYNERLFGTRENDPSSIMSILRNFYRIPNINII